MTEDSPPVEPELPDATGMNVCFSSSLDYREELCKRMREQACIYSLAHLLETNENTLAGILSGTAAILPPAWLHADSAEARITLEGCEYHNGQFVDTPWKMSAQIKIHGLVSGSIDVCYRESFPEYDEGPFLKSERELINAIAERLGHAIERIRAEKALKESEKRLASIIENLQDAYFRTDTDGRFIMVSPSAARIYGYGTTDELLGLPAKILYKDNDERDSIIEEIRQKGRVHDRIGEGRRKDGSTIWVSLNAQYYSDEDGTIKGTEGFVRDITDRRRTEEALRIEKEKLTKYFEITPSIIVVLDTGGVITFLNRPGAAILETEMEEATGMNWFDTYILPDKRELVKKTFVGLMAGDVPEHHMAENDILTGKGNVRTILWYNEILRDDEGSIIGTISSGLDVTARKEAEKEHRRLQEELFQAQKMESIGTLAGGIAHDFNNLLGGLAAGLSVLELELKDTPQILQDLSDMQSLIDRGADLTRQLLGFARRGRYDAQPLDLNGIVEKTVRLFARMRKDIVIYKHFSSELSNVMADHTQLEQVILNMLVNAGQAMDGGGDLTLRTGMVCQSEREAADHGVQPGRYVRLDISDTGVGMDPETLKRIFEPFFTTRGVGKGTGLGLASVYGIVRNHGGFITVESQPGKGSTFSVHLPATDHSTVKTVGLKAEPRQGSETILIIDDEEQIIKTCSRLLVNMGYKVMAASNGREGLELYRQHRQDISLVILDMIMPEMAGHKVFEALREMDHSVRILLSSGFSSEEQASWILMDGSTAFIEKPFGISALSEKLRKLL